jgi:hypothetical protein
LGQSGLEAGEYSNSTTTVSGHEFALTTTLSFDCNTLPVFDGITKLPEINGIILMEDLATLPPIPLIF